MSQVFNLINETKAKLPRLAFESIKDAILGPEYQLNLIITSPAKIKKLNTIYRNKETATDILSFPLSKNEGEIYISPSEAKKEAPKFNRSYQNFLAFLFIHGCAHLKGLDHGDRMEKLEIKFRKKFQI